MINILLAIGMNEKSDPGNHGITFQFNLSNNLPRINVFRVYRYYSMNFYLALFITSFLSSSTDQSVSYVTKYRLNRFDFSLFLYLSNRQTLFLSFIHPFYVRILREAVTHSRNKSQTVFWNHVKWLLVKISSLRLTFHLLYSLEAQKNTNIQLKITNSISNS